MGRKCAKCTKTPSKIENFFNCTNIYLQSISAKFSRIRADIDSDVEEVKAVFGIRCMAEILKSNH